jgi:hypothetical protein
MALPGEPTAGNMVSQTLMRPTLIKALPQIV